MRSANSARTGRWGGAGGYTMVELVMTLTIIGIVAGFAVPRIDYNRYRADAAVRGVRGVLQQAQRLAVLRQYNVIVSFDETNGRIRMVEDADNQGDVDAAERSIWKPLEENAEFDAPAKKDGVNGKVKQAVEGAELDEVGGYPSIIFRRDGASSTDLEVYLRIGTGSKAAYRGVAVTQSTGRADAYRLNADNGKWVGGGL